MKLLSLNFNFYITIFKERKEVIEDQRDNLTTLDFYYLILL